MASNICVKPNLHHQLAIIDSLALTKRSRLCDTAATLQSNTVPLLVLANGINSTNFITNPSLLEVNQQQKPIAAITSANTTQNMAALPLNPYIISFKQQQQQKTLKSFKQTQSLKYIQNNVESSVRQSLN